MKAKKNFFNIGEIAPFGDGTEIESCELYMGSINCERKKGYEKFCEGCNATTPNAMKDFISKNACMDDEPYYCYWCEFIRKTEIDDLLVLKEEELSKEVKKRYLEEDDGADAMLLLEDSGAFADEGIMPGCISKYLDYKYEMEDIEQEFKDMAFVGKCIRLVREKVGMSIEVLAESLEIPVSFIDDIESGTYINTNDKKSEDGSLACVCPVQAVIPAGDNEIKEKKKDKKWWQSCSDESIKEKVANYLCKVLNNEITKSNVPLQLEDANIDKEIPF